MRKLLALSVLLLSLGATSTAQGRDHGIGTAVRHTIRRAPSWFVPQARCVHMHEEHWTWNWGPAWHPHYSYWNGYYTGMQFAPSTWARANRLLGAHVRPTTRNPRIIIMHAYAIVRSDGGSWREWTGTADVYCGLPT